MLQIILLFINRQPNQVCFFLFLLHVCSLFSVMYSLLSNDTFLSEFKLIKPDFPIKTKWISIMMLHITKTCLYNFDPLKPHFYTVKLGFTGVYIIFLIPAQKHRLWVLIRTASLRQF